jgi:hypothetical protein
MTVQGWHVDERLAERYAAGGLATSVASSIEQHLVACAECRARLTPYADPARADRVWTGVLDEVQAPRAGAIERLLRRCGLTAPTARLLALTPSLRASWLTGVVLVLLLAQLSALGDRSGIALFMVLAPVLPLVSVAAAFGGDLDPSREMAGAAPYPLMSLLLVRTATVVAVTVVPAVLLALLLPGPGWLALGWLLPSLALSGALLVAEPWVPPLLGAGTLSAAWMLLVGIGWMRESDPFLVATPAVQLTSVVVLVAALVLLGTRQATIAEQIRRPS